METDTDNPRNPVAPDGTGTTASRPQTGKIFSVWKVLVPVLIGVTVVVLMFLHESGKENLAGVLSRVRFDGRTVICIFLAFCFMFGRDFGLSWRFRALTGNQLRWTQAFKVDLLCEFTSCVTPSAVGGSSLGMVFLNSQGIEFGRATTLMITTLFLDELFFVLACPLVILFTPADEIFASGGTGFSHGIRLTFWLVYAGIFAWTAILFVGIILRPQWMKSVMTRVTRIRFLRRWQGKASELGDNMIATSAALRRRPFRFWLEVFGGTALSWISRYMVVNALFFGFLPEDDHWQWVILARQFVIWVVLMISPTPGGSGLSEWLFSEYYGDLVPTAGMALLLAVCWRLISYYLYLLIGCVLVPSWIKNTIGRVRRNKQTAIQKQ